MARDVLSSPRGTHHMGIIKALVGLLMAAAVLAVIYAPPSKPNPGPGSGRPVASAPGRARAPEPVSEIADIADPDERRRQTRLYIAQDPPGWGGTPGVPVRPDPARAERENLAALARKVNDAYGKYVQALRGRDAFQIRDAEAWYWYWRDLYDAAIRRARE